MTQEYKIDQKTAPQLAQTILVSRQNNKGLGEVQLLEEAAQASRTAASDCMDPKEDSRSGTHMLEVGALSNPCHLLR